MAVKIMYVSTNNMWSGSEELWLRSAIEFNKEGYEVYAATKFDHRNLNKLVGTKLNYQNININKVSKLIKRFWPSMKGAKNALNDFIFSNRPDLLVISQGNNIESLLVMEYCISNNIKFVTITQLVAEVHFLYIDANNLKRFQAAYSRAAVNYFVSEHNLLLNNFMLGTDLLNAEVINNPCRVTHEGVIGFPEVEKHYQVALVGRIECFHKGYDLLLDVLSQKKWKERNIWFNIYGDGPHVELLSANIARLGLSNVVLKGHIDDIKNIWKNEHILLMPSRMEGQSLALIEAMSYGRSAIVTEVGGAKELIKDGVNGFVASSATIEGLSTALEKAWINRHAWSKMGVIARETILDIYNTSAEEQLNNKIKKLIT